MAAQDLNAIAFPKLTEEQMTQLAGYAGTSTKTFRAGDRDAKFFVIKSGELEIIDVTGDQPKTIRLQGPGEFTGDVGHLTGSPKVVNAIEKHFVRTGIESDDSQHWTLKRQPFLLETSRPGVFAAGDVRSGSIKRVASAVGEGSMAVQFVHEYLKTMRSMSGSCAHLSAITTIKHPSRGECAECVKIRARWVHLRTCQECGQTLCCDSSPNQHASKHARASGHPVIASAQPGERWLYCYPDAAFAEY